MPSIASHNASSATPAQVLRSFRMVFNSIRTHFQQVEKKVGLGGAQVWALSVIRDQPGIGMGDLARRMDIHQSTASNLVKSLLQKKLILMEKDTLDKRYVHLQVAPKAQALLQTVPGPFEGLLPVALKRLSPATLQRLEHDLGELIALIHADEDAGQLPLAQL